MNAPEIAWHRLTADQRAAVLAVVESESARAWAAGYAAAEAEYFGEHPAPTDDEHRAFWRHVAQHHKVVAA